MHLIEPPSEYVFHDNFDLNKAREQIEEETNRARDQLRAQVAALAVAGAEKILQAEVNANAHAAMLSKLAAEL